MVISVAQLNYHVGNLRANANKIIHALDDAKRQGVDLLVCAEMALTGYSAKDLWLSPDFIAETEATLDELASKCEGIACLIGAPVINRSGVGKPLFNAAVLLENGQVSIAAIKGLVPDYDVFDEYRYFQPADQFSCVEFQGLKIAVTVCEDLWNIGNNPLYRTNPMDVLLQERPDLMINLAASPFASGHAERRQDVMRQHVKKAGIPLLYVNHVGANADLIFDGRSMAWSAAGEMLDELPAFKESTGLYHLMGTELVEAPSYEIGRMPNLVDIALVYQALILGIRDYFTKSGFNKAVLGLSGGLDSAVVAALACEALGSKNVLSVLMPSHYSSDHSVKDAKDLVANVGCESMIIPIHQPTEGFSKALGQTFKGLLADTTEENIQARTRAIILMAISNKFGHVLLNTSNKSEAAVGYGTLYGDMAGALSVIGDLFKTDVYRLADYINREREIIPINTIRKPPSAELRPDQKDSDSLPDYSYLDAVLRAYIEDNWSVSRIKEEYGKDEEVDRIIHMVDRAEFKRYQSPPTLRVSKKGFGPGRLMPLVMKKSY